MRSRVVNRLLGLATWVKLRATRSIAGRVPLAQTTAHQDDELQLWQPYGLQARPKSGADAVVLAMGSDAEQRIVLLAGDRRYTILLEEGEVALCDDLGQKIHLTREGIVVDSGSIKLGAGATLKVARETDPVAVEDFWNVWFAAVGTATGVGNPPDWPIGTISDGSTKTRSE